MVLVEGWRTSTLTPPPAITTWSPILLHPGFTHLYVISCGNFDADCHPLLLVGFVVSTWYSRISFLLIIRKLSWEILTAHGRSAVTGIAGPATHSVDPAARKSVVFGVPGARYDGYDKPPIRYVPMFSILTDAWSNLFLRQVAHQASVPLLVFYVQHQT